MRKIRVLHVIDSLDLGGAQEALVNLCAFADRDRFDIEVASMHRPGVYSAALERLGLRVHSLSPHKFLPLYVPRLAVLCGRFDIVHAHLIAANIVAKPLAALRRVPVIFNHDQNNDEYRQRDRLRFLLDRWANRYATHICAVSRSIVEFLATHERIPREKLSLIYNAIDLRRFTPAPRDRARWGLPEHARIIGGIGRLNYQKNFALFLDIAAAIVKQRDDVHFVLAGSGPEERALREKAAALNLTKHVTFLGYVTDTAQLYPALDLLLMPSRFEGLPMTLLEAMAMRVPVVASRLDGIAEILTDHLDGSLAEPGNAADFTTRLLTLLDDPSSAKAQAEAAHANVTKNFDAQQMTRAVELLYLRHLHLS